ncbi:diguanylate cyclase [Celerinatantimonas sp. YJH-8]|uniref:diguanylate cyclase n=1 Tax=Celerinatantimonas sp. YJH-8 TaxID=3228714 RepID=UPI0038C3AE83
MDNVNLVLDQLTTTTQLTDQSNEVASVVDEQALTILYNLVSHLCVACKGIHKSLDNRLAELSQQLETGKNISQMLPFLINLDQMLKLYVPQVSSNYLYLQALIHSSTNKLKQVNGLPPKLRQQLKEFSEQTTPETFSENQQRLAQVFEFYHLALTNKPISFTPELESSAPVKHSLLDQHHHQRICDELQRLISELDFHGKATQQLQKIRDQLLTGVSPDVLPNLCQQVIQLMIEGMREERKESQEYVFSLNQNLQRMNQDFSEHVALSQNIHQNSRVQHKSLTKQIVNLGLEVKASDDLNYTKQLVQQRIIQIGNVLKENDRLDQQVQELAQRLALMDTQLERLRKQSEQQQKRLDTKRNQLFIDSLTQVYNRNALDERMELEYKRWRRYGYQLAIAIIDIDHFKVINQQFGHLAGDKALKVVARALQSSLRDTDFLARFGGEEFVILMPKINADDLMIPLEHVCEHIRSLPFRFKQQQVTITVSIGATLFRDNDKLLDAFERADQALYEAKSRAIDSINIIN